jgi:uncharacterized membrane protein YoaK (UPF0700 family)
MSSIESQRQTLHVEGGSIKPRFTELENDTPNKLFNERSRMEFWTIIIGGSLLAFNAGYINGVTMATTPGYSTTHHTGSITNIALEIQDVRLNIERALVRMGHIAVFMLGAMFSGILLPKNHFRLVRSYIPAMVAITFVLFTAAIHDQWGAASEDFAYLCSLAAGMQNALTTHCSGCILRTTHMSGIITDIGIELGKILRGNYMTSWKLIPFISLLVMFFLGSLLAGGTYPYWGRSAMFFSAAFFTVMTIVYALYMYFFLLSDLYKLFFGHDESHHVQNTDGSDLNSDDHTVHHSTNTFHIFIRKLLVKFFFSI